MADLATTRLFRLDGQVVLLTGAGGEIGGWLAAGLAAAGARLALLDRDRDGLRRTADVVEHATGDAPLLLVEDLGDPASPARAVSTVERELGAVDVLVNCAAVNSRQPLLEIDVESFERLMAVDLRAPFQLAQETARAMVSRGHGGAIVNVGSITVTVGLEDVAVYGAAKAALAQLTRTMAVEWSRYGIRINSLCPGFMMTALSEPVWRVAARRRWLLARIPMRRPGLPSELVGLLLLLCTSAGSYINGQAIFADGGFLAGSRWDEEL